ncbi:MAG TPA: hypothetical protein VD998_03840 [Verrucomicrobiae bacterium]|nr:hypothetical protein [Verrucomicrobiae bacterium]
MRIWIECTSQSAANNLLTCILVGSIAQTAFPAEISPANPNSINVDFGDVPFDLAYIRTWTNVKDCGLCTDGKPLPSIEMCLHLLVKRAGCVGISDDQIQESTPRKLDNLLPFPKVA